MSGLRFISILLFFALTMISTEVIASDIKVEVTNAKVREKTSSWGKLFSSGIEAEGYMNIIITGGISNEDELVAVQSELAEDCQLYLRSDVGKTLPEEKEMKFIPIEKNKPTELKYMGKHVRFYGIEYMPEVGKDFPMILVFKEAGRVGIMAKVVDEKRY